jgi:uncharacterized protein YndB with AHSA1/START domain
MDETLNRSITVDTQVNATIEKVWEFWTTPEHISQWNNMSDDWHSPKVENDLRAGGKFLFVMALKDGTISFDFSGTYEEVTENQLITYTLDDGRKSKISFINGPSVTICETFEPENAQPLETQTQFCEAILNSFKQYAESESK